MWLLNFNQSDGYKSTGCYNLESPGFVQANRQFALGSILGPLSSYSGDQFDVLITIFKVSIILIYTRLKLLLNVLLYM